MIVFSLLPLTLKQFSCTSVNPGKMTDQAWTWPCMSTVCKYCSGCWGEQVMTCCRYGIQLLLTFLPTWLVAWLVAWRVALLLCIHAQAEHCQHVMSHVAIICFACVNDKSFPPFLKVCVLVFVRYWYHIAPHCGSLFKLKRFQVADQSQGKSETQGHLLQRCQVNVCFKRCINLVRTSTMKTYQSQYSDLLLSLWRSRNLLECSQHITVETHLSQGVSAGLTRALQATAKECGSREQPRSLHQLIALIRHREQIKYKQMPRGWSRVQSICDSHMAHPIWEQHHHHMCSRCAAYH